MLISLLEGMMQRFLWHWHQTILIAVDKSFGFQNKVDSLWLQPCLWRFKAAHHNMHTWTLQSQQHTARRPVSCGKEQGKSPKIILLWVKTDSSFQDFSGRVHVKEIFTRWGKKKAHYSNFRTGVFPPSWPYQVLWYWICFFPSRLTFVSTIMM